MVLHGVYQPKFTDGAFQGGWDGGGSQDQQLQGLYYRGNAVWCKHPFTTLLYMQKWSSSGMRSFGLLSLTPEHGTQNVLCSPSATTTSSFPDSFYGA